MRVIRKFIWAMASNAAGLSAALALAAGLACGTALGDDPSPPPTYDPVEMEILRNAIRSLEGPVANCQQSSRGDKPLGDTACIDAYEKLYSKDTLNVRLFFGYTPKEADPGIKASDLVFDGYVKTYFNELLTMPCQPNMYACGFTPDPDDADVLYKDVQGPDGAPKRVKITLESTSVSDSDKANRHALKSEQTQQTAQIQKDYLNSLCDSDMSLYAGHARHGSGPGFKPLPTMSWSWIDAGIFKPSLHKTENALKNCPNPPALIGIYACTSDHYYRKDLSKVAPSSGWVLTDSELTFEETWGSLLGTLNATLGLECEADFKGSLFHATLSGFFPPGGAASDPDVTPTPQPTTPGR